MVWTTAGQPLLVRARWTTCAQIDAESALLLISNDDSASAAHRESALLLISNADSASGACGPMGVDGVGDGAEHDEQ